MAFGGILSVTFHAPIVSATLDPPSGFVDPSEEFVVYAIIVDALTCEADICEYTDVTPNAPPPTAAAETNST
jgi:hypothetical protein